MQLLAFLKFNMTKKSRVANVPLAEDSSVIDFWGLWGYCLTLKFCFFLKRLSSIFSYSSPCYCNSNSVQDLILSSFVPSYQSQWSIPLSHFHISFQPHVIRQQYQTEESYQIWTCVMKNRFNKNEREVRSLVSEKETHKRNWGRRTDWQTVPV